MASAAGGAAGRAEGQGGPNGPENAEGQGGPNGPENAEGQGGPNGPGNAEGQGGPNGPGNAEGQGGPNGPGNAEGQGGPNGPGNAEGQGGPNGPENAEGQGRLNRPYLDGVGRARARAIAQNLLALRLGGGILPGPGAPAAGRPRIDMLYGSLGVPFMSSVEAEIARQSLAQRVQPDGEGSVKEITVSGNVLTINLSSEDPAEMGNAIRRCLNQLSQLGVPRLYSSKPPLGKEI